VLHGGEVGLPEIMHVQADLLDGIGDVGVGERQVLEDPSEAPEVSRMNNKRPKLDGDLCMCIYRRQNRLAVHHARSLRNIVSKLTLSEKELVHLMLYGDSHKMIEGSDVLHDEFPLEGRYSLLQKCYARCIEDNVITVKQ
jgi:hypothetical protein